MAKTRTEKIEGIQTQIQELENLRKQLIQQQKAQDRKDRTHRLIERGLILESLISGADTFTNDQIKTFLEKTVQSDFARKILDGMAKQSGEAAPEKAPWMTRRAGAPVNDKDMDTTRETG